MCWNKRFVVSLLVCLWPLSLLAAPPADLIKPQKPYPRKNMSVCYEVDPNWPKPRPAGIQWGRMPGVAVDARDQVWLFTRAKPPVQVYTPDGRLVRSWGSELINTAHFLRLDPRGNVWVADVTGHVVLEFTPEGKLLRTLGTRDVPGEDATHFNRPTDMAITPAGDVFVSDGYVNSRVVHFDPQGRFVKAWGKAGHGPGEFCLPHSIVVDSQGKLYVADRSNARIQVFDQQGRFLAQWRNIMVPWGLAITKDDQIWACGCSPMGWRKEDKHLSCPPKDQLLVKFDTSGRVLQLWTLPLGQEGKERPGEVNWLHGVDVDSKGNLYVGDIMGKRAQKLLRRE